MKTKSLIKRTLLIGSIILSVLLVPAMLGGVKTNSNDISLEGISSSAIQETQIDFVSSIDRVLENLDVTVDLSSSSAEPHTDAIEVNMTISLSNGTTFNVTQTSDSGDIWSLDYIPDKDAPIGQHQFNITVYNGSDYFYSANYDFEIKNSCPSIGLMLSTTEVYRNTTIYYNVTPTDAENSLAQLSWSSAIIRVSNGQELAGTNNTDLVKFYDFPDDYSDSKLGQYYIQAAVEDKDGNSTILRKYFTLLNNIPQFMNDYSITFEDSEYTNPANNEILRSSGTIYVDINVTDVERVITSDVRLKAFTLDPESNSLSIGTYSADDETPDDYYEFDFAVNIPAYEASGSYELHLITYENSVGIEYNTTMIVPFTVVNNRPDGDEITFTINGVNSTTGSGLTIEEFEDITFEIEVDGCDVEGIEFIILSLIDANENWVNFTFDNNDENEIEFSMRARDLTPGQWNAYVYAVDFDGAKAVTTFVMSFDVEKDNFSVFLPYLMLIIGAAAGFGITFLIFGTRYLTLQREIQEGSLSTDEADVKRVRTRRVKQKRLSKRKTKKSTTKSSTKTKEEKSEEPEEKSKTPKKGSAGNRRRMMRRIDKD